MKLSVSTLGCTEKSIEDTARLCRKCGIEGIEVRGIGGIMDTGKLPGFSSEELPKTNEILQSQGVKIIGFGTSCAFHDPKKLSAVMTEGMEAIEVASRVGARFIRVFGNKIPVEGLDAGVARIVFGIGELCEFAADKGLDVLLEVHGDFNSRETLCRVFEGLCKKKNFGVIWDIMHSDRVYGDDIDTDGFYDFLFPFVKHVHVKDYLRGTPPKLTLPGEGDIPIVPIVNRLCNDGYDGYFSFEWERKWHPELCDADTAFPFFSEYMRSNFGAFMQM